MLLLKVQALSYGHSGIQLETIERLIQMFNKNILPVIFQQGSLGASGDLSPLAHLSLPLLGLGKVIVNGKEVESQSIMKSNGWKAITLKSKEGLALLNGTQFMGAYGVWSLIKAKKKKFGRLKKYSHGPPISQAAPTFKPRTLVPTAMPSFK